MSGPRSEQYRRDPHANAVPPIRRARHGAVRPAGNVSSSDGVHMNNVTPIFHRILLSERVILCPNCMWPIDQCTCKNTLRRLLERLKAVFQRRGA